MFSMFSMFRTKKIERDPVLQQVVDLLFPGIELTKDEDGEYYVDRSVDTNLFAALVDLRDDRNDQVVHDTIDSVIAKLREARKILEAEQEKIGKESNLLVVDN